jgi:hypothetical protein
MVCSTVFAVSYVTKAQAGSSAQTKVAHARVHLLYRRDAYL